MSSMAGALPEYQSTTPGQMSQHDQQRMLASTPSAAPTYHSQQLPNQPPLNPSNYPTHPPQYASAYQQGYAMQQNPQSHSGGPSPINPSYPGGGYFPAQQQQYMYFAGQHPQFVQTQHGSFSTPYGSGYMQQITDMPSIGGRGPHSGYSPSTPSAYTYGSNASFLRPGVSGKSSVQ